MAFFYDPTTPGCTCCCCISFHVKPAGWVVDYLPDDGTCSVLSAGSVHIAEAVSGQDCTFWFDSGLSDVFREMRYEDCVWKLFVRTSYNTADYWETEFRAEKGVNPNCKSPQTVRFTFYEERGATPYATRECNGTDAYYDITFCHFDYCVDSVCMTISGITDSSACDNITLLNGSRILYKGPPVGHTYRDLHIVDCDTSSAGSSAVAWQLYWNQLVDSWEIVTPATLSTYVWWRPDSYGFDCVTGRGTFDIDTDSPGYSDGSNWPESITIEPCGPCTFCPGWPGLWGFTSCIPTSACDDESIDTYFLRHRGACTWSDTGGSQIDPDDVSINKHDPEGPFPGLPNTGWQLQHWPGGGSGTFTDSLWILRCFPTAPFDPDTSNEDAIYIIPANTFQCLDENTFTLESSVTPGWLTSVVIHPGFFDFETGYYAFPTL